MTETYIIGPFAQIITMADSKDSGPIKNSELVIITKGGILIEGDRIANVGEFESLVKQHDSVNVEEVNGDAIALPGLIDCHTHICFAGSRAKDHAMRNAGKTYLEIAKEGGGIWDSVTQTRAASESQLVDAVIQRANVLLHKGITTVEVKSGYGLSVAEELKMLRAIKKADRQVAADLISTCLAAHVKPKDFLGSHTQYLEVIAKDLFPILIEEKLTSRIDAFIEEEAFSGSVVKQYFDSARFLGFDITVHADQFHTGGSAVAVAHNALSADHLEASGPEEIDLIAMSSTIAVALPGASLGLGVDFTPARKILDAGGRLAIASDWNPGSAPMGDLLTQASILANYEKLSNAEVFAGLTYQAARALNLSDRGRIKKGFRADLCVFPTNDYNEILYHQGQLQPSMTICKGVVISGS